MSRDIKLLLPELQVKCLAFLDACFAAGYKVIITQTYRTYAEQDAIYAQGRTTLGQIVTHAKGGESNHNFHRAFDIAVFNPSTHNLWWDAPNEIWSALGELGEAQGLTWGGRWPVGKVDRPHFEYLEGKTLAELQKEHNDEHEV